MTEIVECPAPAPSSRENTALRCAAAGQMDTLDAALNTALHCTVYTVQ